MASEYGLRKAFRRENPEIDLLIVPHKGSPLVVGYPAFGSGLYGNNISQMQRRYFHSEAQPNISFRPLTTAESISVAAYKFSSRAKPAVFDPSLLQTGYVLRTNGGVWANSLDAQGRLIQDESVLKQHLSRCEKIRVGEAHIYLGENDFGFAEYGTFEQGVQDCDTFADSGLARVLEHTKGRAENLRTIASPKLYNQGVNVFGFNPTSEFTYRVARLGSYWGVDGGRLYVVGYDWLVDDVGCAFGGLKTGEASAIKDTGDKQ